MEKRTGQLMIGACTGDSIKVCGYWGMIGPCNIGCGWGGGRAGMCGCGRPLDPPRDMSTLFYCPWPGVHQ